MLSTLLAATVLGVPITPRTVAVPSPNPKVLKSQVTYLDFGPTPLGRHATAVLKRRAEMHVREHAVEAQAMWNDKVMRDRFPFELELRSTPATATNRMISVKTTGMGYLGGAHPHHFLIGETFVLKAGKPADATLKDLINLPNPVEFITPILVDELRAQEMTGFSDFQAGIINPIYLDGFIITKFGVTWMFPHYSVGAYAEGSREVTIPWSRLDGLIGPVFARD